MDKLRPYQSEGIKKIFAEWRNGKRSVLFQMPTGTGKTILFSEIVKKGYEQQKKILVIAHRKELVEQIQDKLKHYGVEAGIIMAGTESDSSKIVQIASIQTLSRRDNPEANLIIIDECHHAKANSYAKLWSIYPNAKFLGVTATPIRSNGEGFDDLFEVLIPSMMISTFIEQGYLSRIKHFVCSHPNLRDVKQQRGDYIPQMLKNVMIQDGIMGNIIESYVEKAWKKSTIVFAVDIEHSQTIVEQYKNIGITAEHIDAKTPKTERNNIIAAFKRKEINVISNVGIITEGFDFPECEVVQLARPTKSLALYLQMTGRVMRTSKNKKYGLILDNAGLWVEHGQSTINRYWSLNSIKRNKNTARFNYQFAALDKIRVGKKRPIEVEGLALIELPEERERLLIFEDFFQTADSKGYKLLSSYKAYKAYLMGKNSSISKPEFEYIKERLNKINSDYPEEKKFKSGFWFNEEMNLCKSNPDFRK